MFPTEQDLVAKPFETFSVGENVIWYDGDLELFMVGSADPDGCDDAEEFDTYGEAVAFLAQ